MKRRRLNVGLAALLLACIVLATATKRAGADPGVYELDRDPAVGFNLISWWSGTNASHWINAIDRLQASGFREVSISPLRFIDTSGSNSGTLSASGAPSLTGLAAGVAHAKSLGLRVTLNPFVEPQGFSTWRGFYNPSGAEAARFWTDYEAYLVEVANIAVAHDVDAMNVGTEMRQMVNNAAHNDNWHTVIEAVDEIFAGQIGYAANWDHFAFGNGPGNVTAAIFDHPAIDYVGIDSYFTNLVSAHAVATSGNYPSVGFINTVERGWRANLQDRILPYAAARKGGAGLPVVFTEFGHLPFNGTARDPQNQNSQYQPPVLDTDEQLMAFEGFLNAIDGMGETIPAVHIWHWEMTGSGGSLWNINPDARPDQPHNAEISRWLVDFVSTATILPDGAGDYNRDGVINAADYTVWRNTRAETVPRFAGADGNGNGIVDDADYDVWRGNFGANQGRTAQAVPETPTLLSVTFALVGLIWRRCGRFRSAKETSRLCSWSSLTTACGVVTASVPPALHVQESPTPPQVWPSFPRNPERALRDR